LSATIATLSERALVERIRACASTRAPHITIGIGDDAAVIEPERGSAEVVTTDTLVEHVHFRRDWTCASAIGHKALAVNLSDLAAMGATPRASLLSLVMPADFPLEDFDALVEGFARLAGASGAVLIGGNLTRSPGPLIVDATAIGHVRRRRVLRRDAARAGDDLYVTGTPGSAAVGLAMLRAGVPRDGLDAALDACLLRYERPDARWRAASIVARSGASIAAMDLSDGLADAARQMAEASRVGVVIDRSLLPISTGVTTWASRNERPAPDIVLAGGEDYELAFAVRPRQRRRFLAAMRRSPELLVTRVGGSYPSRAPGSKVRACARPCLRGSRTSRKVPRCHPGRGPV
jgi:thiamine-monophosphate kinase